jgi:hypothetical protein
MATLASTGQQDTNENNPYSYAGVAPISENNPYQQALQGGAASNVFAGLPKNAEGPYTPAQLAPAGQAYQNQVASNEQANTAGSPFIGTNAVRSLGTNAPIPDDSTQNTPEAASASAQAAQQGAANLQQANHALSPKTAAKVKTPTEQQDVNAALAPDEASLDSLASEDVASTAALAPYVNSGQNTGNAALNAADAAVAKETDSSSDPVLAALQQLPKDASEYAKSVPYQGIIQSLLGYNKYEQTYGGLPPTGQSSWSQSMDEIYSYLSGKSTGSNNGLPTPAAAAASASADTTSAAYAAANATTGGGNG